MQQNCTVSQCHNQRWYFSLINILRHPCLCLESVQASSHCHTIWSSFHLISIVSFFCIFVMLGAFQQLKMIEEEDIRQRRQLEMVYGALGFLAQLAKDILVYNVEYMYRSTTTQKEMLISST